MDELLTSKQVQDLLKIDRTTVYRMLNDGRLIGVKVGGQWRFSRQGVDALLSGSQPADPTTRPATSAIIPLHCIQSIQDVFAELAQVGAVTTAPDGEPLTEISNCCRFCNLILHSPSGRRACVASWRKLGAQRERRPHFVSCHAGLQYARACIDVKGSFVAMLFAGQFYARPPGPVEEKERVRRLAEKHGLDESALAAAARELPVLHERMQSQIGAWLEKVAHTFATVGRERADLTTRLEQIAALSALGTE